MKKNMLKNNKGITLVILLITIVVLSILATITIKNVYIGTDIRNYNYLCADIELLQDKVNVYYLKNATLPIKGEAFSIDIGNQASTRDNGNYYQIDLNLIKNATLNFGGGNLSNRDIYIVNEQSHKVYYLKGVRYENILYHTYRFEKGNGTTGGDSAGGETGGGDSGGNQPATPTVVAGNKATENSEYTSNNKTAIIPGGFTVSGVSSESTIDGGLVIYLINDKSDAEIAAINWNDETTVAELQKTYDQFVWIPIPRENINDMYMCQNENGSKSCNITVEGGVAKCTTHNSTQMAGRLYVGALYFTGEGNDLDLNLTNQQYTANRNFREPDIVTECDNTTSNLNVLNSILQKNFYPTNNANNTGTTDTDLKTYLQEEYNSIVKSVYENEGFYVGRYETSNIGNTDGTAVNIKAGVVPTGNKNWYYMYAQQKDYSTNNLLTTVGSTMIQGAAYDQVMKFVNTESYDVKATGYAYHKGNDFLSGNPFQTAGLNYTDMTTYKDVSKNIFDLEGNMVAYTTEASELDCRVIRGGSYIYEDAPCARYTYYADSGYKNLGSMVQLYIIQ